MPRGYKVDLYVVGGVCVVSSLGTRASTTDIDAVWNIGSEMRECINEVGDKFGLGHTWCNCDFKRTKSYTDAIAYNSYIYREFDRLIIRMVNLDLLLAMKMVAFREHKQTDKLDVINIIKILNSRGINCDRNFIISTVLKYYKTLDISEDTAKQFLGL